MVLCSKLLVVQSAKVELAQGSWITAVLTASQATRLGKDNSVTAQDKRVPLRSN